MEEILYKLPEFEGPLDLLLHLISKHKLNIYDIKISELLSQYLAHIELMKEQNLDVTSDFLEMAARLVYIKTALLLPKDEGEKLKDELSGQLLEYQACKQIAQTMAEQINLDFISREPILLPEDSAYKVQHNILEIAKSYINVLGRDIRKIPPSVESFSKIVSKKVISIFSKVVYVLRLLNKQKETTYNSVFINSKSRHELVATFLALLELVKNKRVEVFDNNEKIKLLDCGERKWK